MSQWLAELSEHTMPRISRCLAAYVFNLSLYENVMIFNGDPSSVRVAEDAGEHLIGALIMRDCGSDKRAYLKYLNELHRRRGFLPLDFTQRLNVLTARYLDPAEYIDALVRHGEHSDANTRLFYLSYDGEAPLLSLRGGEEKLVESHREMFFAHKR